MSPSPSLLTSAPFVFPVPAAHDEPAKLLQLPPQPTAAPQNAVARPHQQLLASPQAIRSPPVRMSPKPIPNIPIVPSADYFVEPKHSFGSGSGHSRSSSGSSSNISLSKSHKPVNNSISSMASTTSDLTIYENVVFHGQPMAPAMTNDEFVHDPASPGAQPQPKNILNLLLSLDAASETPRNSSLPKASSATESRFNIGRLGRFHTGDNSFIGSDLAPSTSASEASTSKVALLKKQATLPINFPYATETPTGKNFGSLHLTIPLAGPSGSFYKSPMSMKGWSPSSTGTSPITPLDETSLVNLSPSQIKYCNLDQLHALLDGENIYTPVSQLGKVLMIDIRPFSDFIQLHLIGSINICLPSTLLRRNNFDLNRCINSLPTTEKSMILSYLNFKDDSLKNNKAFKFPYSINGLPPIVLIDSHAALPNLLFFIKKWINNDLWDSSAQIFILSEDTKDLPATLVETGKSSLLNMSSPISSNGVPSFAMSTPTSTACLTPSRLVGSDLLGSPATACMGEDHSLVSQFTLPSPRRVFKLRHNEELLATSMAVAENPFESNYATAVTSEQKQNERLPSWLRKSLEDPCVLSNDFHKLERLEQDRLNTAFTGTSIDHENDVPKISSGIEFGHKNRYKDIFLYEHSRVKLDDGEGISNYINASYVEAPAKVVKDLLAEPNDAGPHLKYIATQGPLKETAGDFWRCVVNENCRLIISLTDEIENGVPKCSPFWQSGTYESNGGLIRVNVVEHEKYHDSLVFRRFKITRGGELFDALQAHLTSWPDMLTCDTNEDLIKLITLKYYLVDVCKPATRDYPVIVHCSAGCGRTGTLCAIDTVFTLINKRGNADFEYDPIFAIVDSFRKLRVSMVQTLRQYSLVYDVLWTYVKDGQAPKKEWMELPALNIVQAFVDELTSEA